MATMQAIFNQEAVLTGLIDHYCLVCEVYLQNETEISRHIKSTSHSDNLASCPYYKKCTLDDRIRKVKHGYYCEVCNVLMRTPNNVSLHVTDDKHNDKKVLLVKRVRNTIVDKYGKVIAMENWHGLTDDGTCAICDTEYDDKNAHTLESGHLINLVRKTVEFDSDDNIYRKLDEKTSHCIICNDVVLNDKISAHNEQDKHLSTSRRREIYEISEVDVAVTTHSAQHQQEAHKKQNVNISTLKECQSSVSDSTDGKEAKKLNSSPMKSENKGNANSTTKLTEKHATVKQFLKLFITSLRITQTERLVILNEKFLIDYLRFFFISRGDSYGLQCLLCEVTFAGMIDIELHLKHNMVHAELMDRVSVIVNYENELIRECRPGVYHCAYCNLAKDSIVGLEKHLKSSSHLAERHSAEKRLLELQERHFADFRLKSSLNSSDGKINRFDDSDSD